MSRMSLLCHDHTADRCRENAPLILHYLPVITRQSLFVRQITPIFCQLFRPKVIVTSVLVGIETPQTAEEWPADLFTCPIGSDMVCQDYRSVLFTRHVVSFTDKLYVLNYQSIFEW